MSVYGSVGASSFRPGLGPHQLPPSRKRKDREDDNDDGSPHQGPDARSSSSTASSPHVPQLLIPPAELRFTKQVAQHSSHAAPSAGKPSAPAPAPTPPAAKPGGNRLLMAAYLAHEFLSRGTLFGRPYGTTASDAAQAARKEEKLKRQYEEVAMILWGGGAHMPGVVNPSQLGGWLQKQQEKY